LALLLSSCAPTGGGKSSALTGGVSNTGGTTTATAAPAPAPAPAPAAAATVYVVKSIFTIPMAMVSSIPAVRGFGTKIKMGYSMPGTRLLQIHLAMAPFILNATGLSTCRVRSLM